MLSINPATGQVLREAPYDSHERVQEQLVRAEAAFRTWRETSLEERCALLSRVANGLRSRRDELARLMTREMGKPIGESRGEIEKCAWVCEHYAAEAAGYLQWEEIATDAAQSGVQYEPLGVVLAIMPWNFPFWQVFRFAAPALAAGNAGIVKHAETVQGCAEAFVELFEAADAPAGLLSNLRIPEAQVADVIGHPVIRAVTLTGSERAGRAVAARTAAELKPAVLELGGSDPFIVAADADLDRTVAGAVLSRTLNSGQSCIAAKRFLVEQPVADEFQARLTRAFEALKVGDPLDPETKVGPLARQDLLENLERQVEESIRMGARLLTGGQRLQGAGWFYPPTLLAGVRPGMPAFDEETFGPVGALLSVENMEEAVALANRSRYGLGASLWTSSTALAKRLVPRLEAGHVAVNGIVKSDPRLPFGGIKCSGYGRELGRPGILSFVNAKTFWIAE